MTCFEQCLPQRFCFCATLDRGVLIVGISGLVMSIISLIRAVASGDQSRNVYYGSLVGAILLLIACVFLIVAARTRRRGFCWPYLILSSLVVIIMVINLIGSIVALDGATGFISFVIVALEVYFLLVVIQYYRSLSGTVTVASSA